MVRGFQKKFFRIMINFSLKSIFPGTFSSIFICSVRCILGWSYVTISWSQTWCVPACICLLGLPGRCWHRHSWWSVWLVGCVFGRTPASIGCKPWCAFTCENVPFTSKVREECLVPSDVSFPKYTSDTQSVFSYPLLEGLFAPQMPAT